MMRVESTIRSPSMSSTGSVPPRENAIARRPPGSNERRMCAIPLKSSVQRAFSLKFEKLYCHSTGGDTSAAMILAAAIRLGGESRGPADERAAVGRAGGGARVPRWLGAARVGEGRQGVRL